MNYIIRTNKTQEINKVGKEEFFCYEETIMDFVCAFYNPIHAMNDEKRKEKYILVQDTYY